MTFQDSRQPESVWDAANDAIAQVPVRPATGNRQMNGRGLNIILDFQTACLEPYKSINGYCIGYDHKLRKHDMDIRISKEDAFVLLHEDLMALEVFIEKKLKIEITDNQFSALVSLAFDIGRHAFAGSKLLKELNKGNFYQAMQEFDRWTVVDGALDEAATRRRYAERELFLASPGEPGTEAPLTETVEVVDIDDSGPPSANRDPRKNLLRESRTIHGAAIGGVGGLAVSLNALTGIVDPESIAILKQIQEVTAYLSAMGISENIIVGAIILLAIAYILHARLDDRRKDLK